VKTFVRFIIGLLLVPVCAGLTRTLSSLIGALRPASPQLVPPEAWALGIGFGLWLMIYLFLPRPVRTYVLAHELTHALWATLLGGRASNLRVSSRGGSVEVTRNHFLVTLAPYFFPLYTMIVLLAYGAANLFFDPARYAVLWLALIGFTWGFHATFTLDAMLKSQQDIREEGWLFSSCTVYLFNVLGIALWIVAVTPLDLSAMLETMTDDLIEVWNDLAVSAHLLAPHLRAVAGRLFPNAP
jgi:hypothetical protein